jgi:hypothetical protein
MGFLVRLAGPAILPLFCHAIAGKMLSTPGAWVYTSQNQTGAIFGGFLALLTARRGENMRGHQQ